MIRERELLRLDRKLGYVAGPTYVTSGGTTEKGLFSGGLFSVEHYSLQPVAFWKDPEDVVLSAGPRDPQREVELIK